MSTVGLMQGQPPFIKFFTEEVEDRTASLEAGYYVAKAVPMALLTPAGGRDSVAKPITELLKLWQDRAQHGQQPIEWYNYLKQAYDAWSSGNEIPESGTPILTFLGFSPQQRAALINANVRTVEQCAEMNEDTLAKIGMGGREMKDRAIQALSSADKNAAENVALKAKIEEQGETIKAMQEQLKELSGKRGKPSGT
jgi:hypothetical protein